MAGTGDGSGSDPEQQEPGRRADRRLAGKHRFKPGTSGSAECPDRPEEDVPAEGAETVSSEQNVIPAGPAIGRSRSGFSRPNWTRPEAYGFDPSGPVGGPLGSSSGSHRKRQGRCREEQGLLWGGFSLSAGILTYFSLPEEPSAPVLFCALFVLASWAIWRYRTRGLNLAVLLGLWFCTGFAAGSFRTAYVAAPRLEAARTLDVHGVVTEREQSSSGPRLIVDVLEAGARGRMAPPGRHERGSVIPARIRLSIPDASTVRVGDHVRLKARLFPPSSPIRPGGYDFSFTAYFSGIGATGFSYGKPEVIGEPPSIGLRRALEELRQALAARIRQSLSPGDPAELAVALLVGERGGLSEKAEESLRAAGLAHVLAISGLHMGLFAGGAYAAVLLILAMIEPLALRFPLHKIAAGVALLAASFYLLLSGASVSTQRAFIMISLVFLGILTSRRGLTLHSVALAGIALLLVRPEQLFHPGFQMSFASVICLVAVYSQWTDSRLRKLAGGERAEMRNLPLRLVLTPLFWLFGVLATTAIAGLATGIIGAHHFGRIASYGMIGNLLGMPLVSLIIMPMGVLALALMPLGLSALPLFVMEKGLSMLLAAASFTQSLEDGRGSVVPPGASPTLFLTSGLFWLLLARGRWRLISPGLIAAGLAFLIIERPADIQIADSGATVAARDREGSLRISSARASFAGEMWLQAEGVSPDLLKSRKMAADQAACDETGCVYRAYPPTNAGDHRNWAGLGLALFGLGPAANLVVVDKPESEQGSVGESLEIELREKRARALLIALPKTVEALELDCRLADVVVTDLDVPADCAAPFVISGKDKQDLGALSFWLEGQREALSGADGGERDRTEVGLEADGLSDILQADASESSGGSKAPRRTVISSWRGAKTRPPRPWHQ